MDPELNDRLTKIEKMVSDNNRMLIRMRRAQRNAAFVRVLYWIVIIALAIGAWHIIQPYLASVTNEYNTLTGHASGTTTTGEPKNSTITNLINQYAASQKTGQ